MKKLLVWSLAFVLIISALLLVGCSKEPEKEPVAECPHSYEKTVTPPTCTEAGEEKFSCTKCDYYYTIKIEATGHTGGTPVEENRTEATCTVDGKYDSVIYCTVCDAEVSRETVTVAATGIHNVQNGVCTACGGRESTPGLLYIQNADGTYTAMGIGTTCTETDIVIGIYNNRDVTAIGNRAFSGCTSLTSITVSEGNENYKSVDGNLYSKDGEILIQYAIGKIATAFTVPEGVTAIGNEAFFYCESLTSIELPDSLTTIGVGAFYYCTSLKSIVIPEGVTTIGNYAFYNCTSLTSIELPDSLTTIGNDAFFYCESLTSIELPDSLTTIGNEAFCGCISLSSIVIPDSVTTIGYWAFSGCTSLTIYCEVAEKPSGWSNSWNSSNRPVVWGYKGE